MQIRLRNRNRMLDAEKCNYRMLDADWLIKLTNENIDKIDQSNAVEYKMKIFIKQKL